MIKVYKNRSYNFAIDRIKTLFNNYHVSYEILNPQKLKREYIQHILKISDNGFEQIMVSKIKGEKLYSQVFGEKDIEDYTVNEMVDILLIHPQLLRSPIIFNDTKLLVGYNPDEIRLFLPRVRQIHLLMEEERLENLG